MAAKPIGERELANREARDAETDRREAAAAVKSHH